MREETTIEAREIGQKLSVAITAVLFGSTMILSAVGPARASETVIATSHSAPAPNPAVARYAVARYLA